MVKEKPHARQRILTLDFPQDSQILQHDYIISPANQLAYQALIEHYDTNHYATLLIGEAGCGKTTLARIWAHHHNAALLAPPLSDAVLASITSQYYWIDGYEAYAEEALFHLLNSIKEQRANLLICARNSAASHSFALPDLASRMRALHAHPIYAPDDETLEMLMLYHIADKQLHCNHNIIKYLIARMPRSYDAARQLVETMDRISLQEKRSISLSLAKRALANIAGM